MKKQLISSVACFALLVLMFVGSSIAWFTDSASNVNTMVAGKISIDQTEIFDDTTVLLPSVEVQKQVTVENTGNQPCYLRTLFAFEDSEDGSVLDMLQLSCADGVTVTIPGVTPGAGTEKVQFMVKVTDGEGNTTSTLFTVGYYVLPDTLSAEGEDKVTNLKTITLKPEADNSWMEAIGEKYEILVLSQASQTVGLENEGSAAAALNKAFAPVDSEHCVIWFEYVLKNTQGYVPEGGSLAVTEYPAAVNP